MTVPQEAPPDAELTDDSLVSVRFGDLKELEAAATELAKSLADVKEDLVCVCEALMFEPPELITGHDLVQLAIIPAIKAMRTVVARAAATETEMRTATAKYQADLAARAAEAGAVTRELADGTTQLLVGRRLPVETQLEIEAKRERAQREQADHPTD